MSHHAGLAKHYWMLSVLGGALIVALATWTIRRRHGGRIMEPKQNSERSSIRFGALDKQRGDQPARTTVLR